jgi:peptide deformylase
MAVHTILHAENPLLRQKSQKVKHFDHSLQKLIADMVDSMHAANGLGLAAPQIGVPLRLAVVEAPLSDETENAPVKTRLYVLVNPEILHAEGEDIREEGCLSLPHYYGEVKRAQTVVVRCQDRRGRTVKIKGAGILARALQHEVDHLNGILFVDRLEDIESLHYRPPQEQGRAETGL